MSWYPNNHTFNFRNKCITSRWTHADEVKFMDFEESVYGGKLTPKSSNFWKKIARAQQGDLDEWSEKHARVFLDQYIQRQNMRQ